MSEKERGKCERNGRREIYVKREEDDGRLSLPSARVRARLRGGGLAA